jgi:hypothetical protein
MKTIDSNPEAFLQVWLPEAGLLDSACPALRERQGKADPRGEEERHFAARLRRMFEPWPGGWIMAGHDERTGLPGNLTKPFNRTNDRSDHFSTFQTTRRFENNNSSRLA